MDVVTNDLILDGDMMPLAARGVEQELYVFICIAKTVAAPRALPDHMESCDR